MADNIKRQYARNADRLQRLLDKAVRTGRKVNGYTADELRQSIAAYRALSLTGVVPSIPDAATRFAMAAKRLRDSRGGRPVATLVKGRFVFTYPDGTKT